VPGYRSIYQTRVIARVIATNRIFSLAHRVHEHGVIKSSKLFLPHISRHFVAAISYKLHDSASGVTKILSGDCRKRISALIIYYSVGHIRIATVRAMTRSKLRATPPYWFLSLSRRFGARRRRSALFSFLPDNNDSI